MTYARYFLQLELVSPSPYVALTFPALTPALTPAQMSTPTDLTRQPLISEFPGDAIDTAVSDLEFCTGPQATVVLMRE